MRMRTRRPHRQQLAGGSARGPGRSSAPGLGLGLGLGLALAAGLGALFPAAAHAAPPPTAVAVLVADDALGQAVVAALADAGLAAARAPAADQLAGVDLDAARAHARALAHAGQADAVVVGAAAVLRQQAAATGSSAWVEVHLVAISGRSGKALAEVRVERRGGAGDPARALAKARQAATEAAGAELAKLLAPALAAPTAQALALTIEVRGLDGDGFDRFDRPLRAALEQAGLTVASSRHDQKARRAVLECSHASASQEALERLLRRAMRDAGLLDQLAFADSAPGALAYVYQDPRRVVPIAVVGVDEGSQRKTGAELAEALDALAPVARVDRRYDAASETLTLEAAVEGSLAALDALVAAKSREGGPLAALELIELGRDALRYRLVRAVEARVVELIGFPPADTAEVAIRLDPVIAAIEGVLEHERAEDAALGQLRFRIRFQGRTYELEKRLLEALRGPAGFARVTPVVPGRGADLGFRIAIRAKTSYRIRIRGVSPSLYQEVGQPLVEAIAKLDGVAVIDRQYEDERLDLVIEAPDTAYDLDARVWQAARALPALKRLGPADSRGTEIGYLLLPEDPTDYTATIVVSRLGREAEASDGRALVDVIRGLDGAREVKPSYHLDRRELEIALRFSQPPFALEERLWQALEGRPLGQAFAREPRRGSVIRLAAVEQKGERSRLFVRADGLVHADARAAADRLVERLKLHDGLSGIETLRPAPERLEVQMWSSRDPVAVYDEVAGMLAKDATLAALADQGLEGNVIALRARRPEVASAPAMPATPDPAGPGTATTGPIAPSGPSAPTGPGPGTPALPPNTPSTPSTPGTAPGPGTPPTATPDPAGPTPPGPGTPNGTAPTPGTPSGTAPGTPSGSEGTTAAPAGTGPATATGPATPTGPGARNPLAEGGSSAASAVGIVVGPERPVSPSGGQGLADLVETLDPAVVSIRAWLPDGGSWIGSGFIISPRGYVLTNQHVAGAPDGIPQSAVRLEVKLADGRTLEARYIDGKADVDLALLKLPGDGFPAAVIGDSDRLRPGDGVVLIGNPLGLEHSVTTGIVSGLDRERGRIQTNALINPGNSGGPAFDESGRVVGIAVAGRVEHYDLREGTIRVPYPGLNFLVPINHAFEYLEIGGAR